MTTIKVKLTRQENCAHYGVSSGTVVTLDLEGEYLPICVSSEIYENDSRTPPEAKKAQAIAARTYIAAHALAGNVIDDTATYQAFKWKDLSTIPNSFRAVQDTSGQVLLYGGALITAWYSNSNGGRTKRSDEAWSVYKPWTVAKDDPWDTAGRAKWGEVKPGHCVGMSQIGAAYAAYIGRSCGEILGFYYPGTTVAGNYGNGDIVSDEVNEMAKTNAGLVAWAREWLGQAYWYGTCCYKCTQSLLTSKQNQYPSHYTQARMPRYKDDIAKGRSCADCIGLLKGYLWEKDGKIVYDASTDMNTGGLFNRATVKGPVQSLPEVPGVMMYKDGHVGVYEGNGTVVEAKGFDYGIIRSNVQDTAWTYWLAVPYLSYAGYESLLLPQQAAFPYTALVATKQSPLNIWSDTKKTKSLLQVPRGDTLTVTGFAPSAGWYAVTKMSVSGYADGQYLVAAGGPDPAADDDAGDTDAPPQAVGDILYQAQVINIKTGLNLRSDPSLSAGNTLLFLLNGAIVDVLQENISGFSFVRFSGVDGYCTSSYLKRL